MRKYLLASVLLVLWATVALASDTTAPTYKIDTAFYETPNGVQCRVTVTDLGRDEVVFAPQLNFERTQGASAYTQRKDDPGAEWRVDASVTKEGLGTATITYSRDGKVLKTYQGTTTISKLPAE